MLLNLRKAVMQGQRCLKPEMQALLRHLVEGGHDRVHSELEAAETAPPTALRAGSAASNPGPARRGG